MDYMTDEHTTWNTPMFVNDEPRMSEQEIRNWMIENEIIYAKAS